MQTAYSPIALSRESDEEAGDRPEPTVDDGTSTVPPMIHAPEFSTTLAVQFLDNATEDALKAAGVTEEAKQAAIDWMNKYRATYKRAVQGGLASPSDDPCAGYSDRHTCSKRIAAQAYRARVREKQLGYGRDAFMRIARASQAAASFDSDGALYVAELAKRHGDRGQGSYRVVPTLMRTKRGKVESALAAVRYEPGSPDHVARTAMTWRAGDANAYKSENLVAHGRAAGIDPDPVKGSRVFNKLKPWQLRGPMAIHGGVTSGSFSLSNAARRSQSGNG